MSYTQALKLFIIVLLMILKKVPGFNIFVSINNNNDYDIISSLRKHALSLRFLPYQQY